MSKKSRIFAVAKNKKYHPLRTPSRWAKRQADMNMNQFLEEINEHGLEYIIMAINDIIENSGCQTNRDGLYVDHTWLTPETCYWLYKLVNLMRDSCLVSEKTLRLLREGTNHPESL